MRLKENSLYSPLDFYWVEKKGVPKAMFNYLDLLAHPLGGF